MENIYQRTELVIGSENLHKLKNINICICGIGGVGSYVLEALARIGIGKITIIDKDIIDITNINRQLIANISNIGMSKVEEAKKRINEINPEILVTVVHDAVNANNVSDYITCDYNYVIDAVDDIDAKIAIIKRCKQANIKIISSMGMANRVEPLKIKVSDIFKTEMCPLAKNVRKRLKAENISDLKVVFSVEEPIKTNSKVLGSIPYVPGTAGLIIASEVIKDLV